MKKAIRIGILCIMVLLMLCVWPFCLVRKTAEVASNLTAPEYGNTEQYIRHDVPYVQSFTAQTARLDYLEFKLYHEQDFSGLPGVLHFCLTDDADKLICEKDIAFSEFTRYFWHADVNKFLQKGKVYRYSVSVDEEYDNLFKAIYTVKTEDDAPGSVELRMGAEPIVGQGLARYGYGYPLNYKNVLCLWAGIAALGLGLYMALRDPKEGTVLSGKSGKYQQPMDKAWALVSKYQILILLAEMAGLLLLILYICRNYAVDWDEAYSLSLVSKLTWKEMLQTTALDMHPPLYYALLRIVTTIFGTEVFTMKLLSLLCTAGVMVLGITLIRKNWGAKAAFLFNLVVGLGPQFIFYSGNIRMYAPACFFVLWNALLAYELIREKGRLKWILFVLSGLGGVYCHYFAVVPLVLIYGYLLVGLFLERREAVKHFFICCGATILGYLPWIVTYVVCNRKGVDALIGHLPWMATVIKSFAREEVGALNLSKIDFADLAEWMFGTNIKCSVLMGVALFVVGVVLFLVKAKSYDRKKSLFLILCATNLLISYVTVVILASGNSHFLDNRYVFAALGTFWLFVVIMFTERGKLVSCALAVFLGVWGLSSYTIQKSVELGTNYYMAETKQLLQQVSEEEEILYNFPTYHIVYGAHLPEQEFIWVEDMDWANYDKDYIYFISWGPIEIPWDLQQTYGMQYVDCGTLRFEEGMAGIKLFKVCIQK